MSPARENSSVLCAQSNDGNRNASSEIDFTGAWRAYSDRWHRPELGLRSIYNHSSRAYNRDFWGKQEVIDIVLELGLQTFAKITQRLERTAAQKDYTRPYLTAGKLALDAFGLALAGSAPPNNPLDVVFVSIDFEGASNGRGANGFGAT
ncbi:hypothetical protein CLAFUW4_01355 [Fulvia fulva]|uniref:Uncharacterized protein n=1 Tax=Passalora fulva TaxID=5499 RepID=A0A9Q8P381_PASFU|nr:uncharacterized protein CLAFUR5_01358 [Fulvia fulva]KAK4634744.1 hypothetical protein CLAFUR4_01356 [Fulvia fulva]KAK4637151.1 hypothetical protein CLAFUR0_01357 [Fulvia fulva]UJO11653.1 hypothetical protein CLAFUR5_01358 [Fulvia fulva]WPV10166.1 hypothetical protein CLAFUW4_01355 [Fulvia fulva]WPV23034.1 hypothetical protein CLAFUW7_01360 [Fulvia fulva]